MTIVAAVLLVTGLSLFHVGMETSGWVGFALNVVGGAVLGAFVIVVMAR